MKRNKFYLFVSVALVASSLIMFYIHYLMFGQLENTIYYSLMSLCFIPINILAVTVVFEKLMERRDKQEKLSKINMLVGLFFSEMGFELMNIIVESDEEAKNLISSFSDLNLVKNKIKKHKHDIDLNKLNYEKLECLLIENKYILANLISNENILEHELFADLLMATLHLRDEAMIRKDEEITEHDWSHVEVDVVRVYKALTIQWVDYLDHMKSNYPYLYKTAIDINPFNKKIY